MKINGPNNYIIRLKNGLKNREIASIEMNGQIIKGLKQPDNDGGIWKIYMVKSGADVIYIGQTKQNILTRLKQGLRAKGEHGYYGYKWRDDLPEVEILVWCFPEESREYVEAVEAELVYLFRHNTNKWPKYQMEIHFYGNISGNVTENVTKSAEEIFDSIYGFRRR